ncbi:hypothetical protein McanCB56680_005701 [Microsporum canis]|uniref:Protein kinase domain-containing protein n=1 Tax=Arthroderma otae (strain ATCC MYA-4605 / CBS 113480) TaxID=554155 RepID=C5FS69_ARTOC|nr:protein kinase domain-containing protein [Microsporum canis CBS 113480]EEQ32722.1 protein kinase domain-containing protein [Microsporum canis CBS 113480]
MSPTLPQYPADGNPADYGDFADSDGDVDIDVYAERQWDYKFYPIRIGEVLNQAYRIDHKLGHGGFSTVWMAHDLKNKKDVALKIVATEAWGEHDYSIQEEIKRAVKDTSHLVIHTATFFLRGKDCNHRVLVFPLRGPTLGSPVGRRTPMRSRMSAAKQLLEALANLHEGGIVHRDINNHNVMWGISPTENLDREAKYKTLGRPLKVAIPDEPWKPGEVVKPMVIPASMRTETFYLGDFSLAMRVGTPVTQTGSPPIHYCSPERLHGHEPSLACDMWSYMVIFTELYSGFKPFYDVAKGGLVTDIVQRIGPLPAEWKGHYCDPTEALDSWYNQDCTPDPKDSLKDVIIRKRSDAAPEERRHALSILSRGFCVIPEKRLTARQLLQDPSFQAIIDLHCN